MATNHLHEIEAQGQAVWLDNISRGLLEDGELTRLIDEDDTSLGTLMGSGEQSTEQEVEVSLSRQAVRAAVEQLPERERQIIKLRFGLDGEEREPLPLSQLQRELGMGREELRAIERRALQHLSLRRELAALSEAA